jgi:hypothetical protein
MFLIDHPAVPRSLLMSAKAAKACLDFLLNLLQSWAQLFVAFSKLGRYNLSSVSKSKLSQII